MYGSSEARLIGHRVPYVAEPVKLQATAKLLAGLSMNSLVWLFSTRLKSRAARKFVD
jgi:hypothetical protein